MLKHSYEELLKTPNLIDSYIQEMLKESEKLEERCYDKLQYSNPYGKELERLSSIKKFVPFAQQVIVSDYKPGLVIVNHKFIVSLRNNRWRVKGRNKWYCYDSIDQLVTKYILKE
jgi:hypothetical protein